MKATLELDIKEVDVIRQLIFNCINNTPSEDGNDIKFHICAKSRDKALDLYRKVDEQYMKQRRIIKGY